MRKTMAKATALVVAAGMLAACGSTGESTTGTGTAETSATSAASGDATVIEVWSNNRHDEEYMTKMVDEFNASHSDIQIEYTILTDDWANSIQLAFQANTAPRHHHHRRFGQHDPERLCERRHVREPDSLH